MLIWPVTLDHYIIYFLTGFWNAGIYLLKANCSDKSVGYAFI